jgi:hypothetical protein
MAYRSGPRHYADDIRRLVSQAYSTCPIKYKQELTKRFFINGIRESDLKEQLLLQAPRTLEQALEFVERWTAMKTCLNGSRSRIHSSKVQVANHNNNNITDHIRMVAPYPDSDEDGDGDEDYELEEGENYDMNHDLIHDLQVINSKYSNHNLKDKSKKVIDWTKVQCFHCNGMGHFSRECPSSSRLKSLNTDRPALRSQEAAKSSLKAPVTKN